MARLLTHFHPPKAGSDLQVPLDGLPNYLPGEALSSSSPHFEIRAPAQALEVTCSKRLWLLLKE